MCRLYANSFHISIYIYEHSSTTGFGIMWVLEQSSRTLRGIVCVGARVESHTTKGRCLLYVSLAEEKLWPLCVLWLTFPKLGDCIDWLLTQESWLSSSFLFLISWPLPSFISYPWLACFWGDLLKAVNERQISSWILALAASFVFQV